MTKKDFELIAQVFAKYRVHSAETDLPGPVVWERLMAEMAYQLQRLNPRFNFQIFINHCYKEC